jgi:hypothetical protein
MRDGGRAERIVVGAPEDVPREAPRTPNDARFASSRQRPYEGAIRLKEPSRMSQTANPSTLPQAPNRRDGRSLSGPRTGAAPTDHGPPGSGRTNQQSRSTNRQSPPEHRLSHTDPAGAGTQSAADHANLASGCLCPYKEQMNPMPFRPILLSIYRPSSHPVMRVLPTRETGQSLPELQDDFPACHDAEGNTTSSAAIG